MTEVLNVQHIFAALSLLIGPEKPLKLVDLQLLKAYHKKKTLTKMLIHCCHSLYPTRELFNYHLLKLTETGLNQNLRTLWYQDDKITPSQHHQEGGVSDAIALGHSNLLFPFTILALGMALGIGVSIYEWQNFRKESQKTNK